MAEPFPGHLDYVYFVYGLSSVLMAAVLWGMERQPLPGLRWRWLAGFGLLHGIGDWTELVALSLGRTPFLAAAELALLTASYCCMLEFARLGTRSGTGRPGRWIHLIPLLLAAAGAGKELSQAEAAVRYAVGLTAGLWCSAVLWRGGGGKNSMRAIALAMAAYALASGALVDRCSFLPARWINTQALQDITGIPVQVVRGALIAAMALGFWWAGEAPRVEARSQEDRRGWQGEAGLCGALLAALAAGWIAARWLGEYRRSDGMLDDLVVATMGAAALDPGLVESWQRAAPGPAEQAKVAGHLLRMRLRMRGACSYHLLAAKDGKLIPLADSEAPGSQGRHLADAEYERGLVRDRIAAVFREARPVEIGPYAAGEAHYLTAAAPVLTRDGRVAAVLALEMDAVVREREIARMRLAPIVGALLICCLILSIYAARRRRRETNQLLRKLSRAVEQSPASIVITDVAGSIEYVNPKFTQLTGYTLEEARGQNPRILKSGLMPPEAYQQLWTTILSGQEWRGEFANRKKDGQIYWELASISPIVNDRGQVTHFLAVKEDITQRKRVEDELRHSLAMLSATLDATADGILVVPAGGQGARFNRKYAELEEPGGGVDAAAILESAALRAADPAQYRSRMREIARNPAAVTHDVVPQAEGRIFERYSQPAVIDGRVVGRVWSWRDVTEVKRLLSAQQVNIDIANQLLRVVNRANPRYVDLDASRVLFIEAVSAQCQAAGGDHFFVRVVPRGDRRGNKTVVSLKDQSGHEVNCVLRSIATDLLHHQVLTGEYQDSLALQMSQLNEQLCRSGIFAEDDFLTAMTVEIDHRSRMLRFASCGHPPLLVIRAGRVVALPEGRGQGQNLPLGTLAEVACTAGDFQLQDGDRLLLYTDGLTEMPLRNGGRRLAGAEFRSLVEQTVANDPELPVRDVVARVLERVTAMSGEQLALNGRSTAADDVTVIGIEVERAVHARETLLRPLSLEDLAGHIEKLFAQMQEQWADEGFEAAAMRLRVVLEEAIINAWKHGNRQRPESAVRVRWHCRNDFVVEVIDEGAGFDPAAIPDPRGVSRRLSTHGRGVFMIQTLCDSVRWKGNGSHLVASFARQSPARARRNADLGRAASQPLPARKEEKVWN